MSVNVPTPQQSEVDTIGSAESGPGEAASSQDSLFSDVVDSIGEFSQEVASSLARSSSPSISSFPSSCSYSCDGRLSVTECHSAPIGYGQT